MTTPTWTDRVLVTLLFACWLPFLVIAACLRGLFGEDD